MPETLLTTSEVLLYGRVLEDIKFSYSKPAEDIPHGKSRSSVPPPPRPGASVGLNAMMQSQLAVGGDDSSSEHEKRFAPRFARIYGFSYEGCYHDLDAPIIMVVHGPGVLAEAPAGDKRSSRAPDSPDRTGAAAAAHSFADEIMVWSYDKADFTIRMDSLSGSIEDVLLDVEIGSGAGPVTGGRMSGGKVSGGKVAGGKVSGGKVSGGKVNGPSD